jgi:hypothetical protein
MFRAAAATQLLNVAAAAAAATRATPARGPRTSSSALRHHRSVVKLSRARVAARASSSSSAAAADEATPTTTSTTSSTTTAEEEELPAPSSSSSSASPPSPKLACPICLQPFNNAPSSSCTCLGCNRTYPSTGGVLQLCLDADGAAGAYVEPQKSGTKLFQSDVISGVYENGWRQSFSWAGFPGEAGETKFALDYMRGAAKGGVVLDVSCGSGGAVHVAFSSCVQ